MARRLAITAVLLGIALGAGDATAGAATANPPVRQVIAEVTVTGLIDPINADLIIHAVHDAESRHAVVLVVLLNSTGDVISRAAASRLVATVRASPVPVAVWVGGTGRPRAYGIAFELLQASAWRGVGPSARIGNASDPADNLHRRSVNGDTALASKVVDVSEPTVRDFIVGMDGRTIGGHALSVAETVEVGGQPRRQLRQGVTASFSQLTVFPRLLHTAASPNVAFAMLIIALSLAVFEFFTAGIGVAAGTGVVFAVLCFYGLGVLPTRPLSVALIGLGMLGCAVNVQSGAPRAWTGIGMAAIAAGSVFLYRGLSVSPWVLIIVGLLLVLFIVSAMPAMIRTRFSTPTIGRESLIGTLGVAIGGVDPEGTVEVNGAPWRARTNRATPISVGAPIRVAGIDGLVLEVEPTEGAARDAHH